MNCICGEELNESFVVDRGYMGLKELHRTITCPSCNRVFTVEYVYEDTDDWSSEKEVPKLGIEIKIEDGLAWLKEPYARLYDKEVWRSLKSLRFKLIRFIIEETPRLKLYADIASGATIVEYQKEFDTLEEAMLFASNEFSLFERGEPLRHSEKPSAFDWVKQKAKKLLRIF